MPFLRRLWAAGGTLLARETMVATNAIAFNFLLCLFPLLLVVVAALQAMPARRVTTGLLAVLAELIPFEGEAMARAVEALGRSARKVELFSLVLIVWGSSGIFMPVEMALNRAWGGHPRTFWRSRLLAFGLTIGGGLLAFLSVAITVFVRNYGTGWPRLTSLGAKATALATTYALFFFVYRLVPDPGVGGRTSLKAALVAGTAWESVKYLFVINLARTNLRALYGPLAFAVALVLWAYVSSLVLVFGALMVRPPGERKRRERRKS
jgi:membrane protein/epoxyqueuosine reductase